MVLRLNVPTIFPLVRNETSLDVPETKTDNEQENLIGRLSTHSLSAFNSNDRLYEQGGLEGLFELIPTPDIPNPNFFDACFTV